MQHPAIHQSNWYEKFEDDTLSQEYVTWAMLTNWCDENVLVAGRAENKEERKRSERHFHLVCKARDRAKKRVAARANYVGGRDLKFEFLNAMER